MEATTGRRVALCTVGRICPCKTQDVQLVSHKFWFNDFSMFVWRLTPATVRRKRGGEGWTEEHAGRAHVSFLENGHPHRLGTRLWACQSTPSDWFRAGCKKADFLLPLRTGILDRVRLRVTEGGCMGTVGTRCCQRDGGMFSTPR